jgi:hypothetical protein
VNHDPDDWFVRGGLVEFVFYIMLSSAFIQPLLYILDPFYLLRLVQRKKAANNPNLTQQTANLLFEGPALDLAQRYANMMKLFLLGVVYAPILPIGLFI